MEMPSTTPVFVRCKHEGDGGAPLSVEWAHSTPQGEIVSAVHLIKPPPEWRSQIAEDEGAATLRGVSLAELLRYGEEPGWIAERMNRVLGGREVYSHTPYDGDPLRRLFDAAQAESDFELHIIYAATLIAEFARVKRIKKRAFEAFKRKAQLRTPIYWPSVALVQMDALLWADIEGAV